MTKTVATTNSLLDVLGVKEALARRALRWSRIR